MTDLHAAERRETVPVALGDRSYDIHIGEGLLAKAGDIVAPFDQLDTVPLAHQ